MDGGLTDSPAAIGFITYEQLVSLSKLLVYGKNWI